ncbi:hypothetical protein ACEZGJ_004853 [Escherichia coli]|nr:hypothetical protein [Escherichia coli]EJW7757874.1 hypothetical protein [Escherichia coli]
MFGNMVSATCAGKTDPEAEWQGAHSGDPNSIRSPHLLIIDEIGYLPFSQEEAKLFTICT